MKFSFTAEESLWNDINRSSGVWPSLIATRGWQRPPDQAISVSSALSCTYSAFALSTPRGLKKNKSVLVQVSKLCRYTKHSFDNVRKANWGVEGMCTGNKRNKKGLGFPPSANFSKSWCEY